MEPFVCDAVERAETALDRPKHEFGCGSSPDDQLVGIRVANAMVVEFVLVEDRDRPIRIDSHVQIQVECLDPSLRTPDRWCADVDVDGETRVSGTEDRNEPGVIGDHREQVMGVLQRRLAAPLDGSPAPEPHPDAVLVLSQPDHVVSPVQTVRVLEELHREWGGRHGRQGRWRSRFDSMGLIDEARELLSAERDPERAEGAAAYLKTDMPFYGVSSPVRRQILKQLGGFAPGTNDEYRSQVTALWGQPHREEKYLAIDWARRHRAFITFENIDLYERMVTEGAWWDLVDDIAANLVGTVVRADLERMRPVLERWLSGDDLWLRRTVIICQLKSKEKSVSWAVRWQASNSSAVSVFSFDFN